MSLINRFLIPWIVFISPLICLSSFSDTDYNKRHVEVSLRMIGHQLLLDSGDSTSVVLPIVKEEGKYILSFGTEFSFEPDELVATTDRIVSKTKIASEYVVDVRTCDSNYSVYSFEMTEVAQNQLIPCQKRKIEKGCYKIFITLTGNKDVIEAKLTPLKGDKKSTFWLVFIISLIVSLIVVFYIFRKANGRKKNHSHLIKIGLFMLNPITAKIILGKEEIQLTQKEQELLILLHSNINETVEREKILHVIWEDEGDYVGRTLDVFISRLRKKLESDPKVRVQNVRGVGYKLAVEE